MELTDRVTVLRDGQWIKTAPTASLDGESIAQLMVGRELSNLFPKKREPAPAETVLSVKNFSVGTIVSDVSFELKRGEQIDGTVSWTRGDSAGIEFEKRVDIVELLATSMDGPRPRMPRVEVRCIASVRQGSNVYGMRAHDISQGGLKVESNRELAIASEVMVTLPGMQSKLGTVRWKDGKFYGITFNRLLALTELVQWLQGQRDLLKAAS